jgi:DNA-binding transcriptional LysR family regulator
VSFSQVQTFVAVAEEGSLSRAARRLRISQPPLTRQIHALEDELGVLLFARSSRGMRLLPAGQAFLARARVVLAEVDGAIAAARQAAATVSGRPD